ncbi:hypothetical protein MHO82_06195 [Vibrio sp. Of7-15]|uniref:hypothetical protein n=1 Tax=Vibrio sp. Of7-15 TaxID=2724879 RepID=UPI001EF2029F|nr:hypothetical protein [Vibrio sp. Of7-15]MCG7496444.1 hypothetical protein [Vibrio sp. Of7-15]
MAQVRPEIYKAITDNDIENVIFSDPFSDVARKSKRNLLAAGFIGLLISVLNLEISGFLGLKATNMNLGNDIAQGLAFLIILYFFLSFMFHAYIDYSAWNFEREKQLTKPYFDLVHLIEGHINVTGEQIKNATSKLDSLSDEESIQAQIEVSKEVKSARQQLDSINTQLSSVISEVNPLISSWRNTIGKMDNLSMRLKARFISLWGLDVIFPLVVASIALYQCYSGVPALILKLTS